MQINDLPGTATGPLAPARSGMERTDTARSGSPKPPDLEQVKLGVLLVDREMRVLSANRVAQRMLESRESLMLSHGRLISASFRETGLLREHVAAMQNPSSSTSTRSIAIRICRPKAQAPLEVVVSSAPDHFDLRSADRPVAMIFIINPAISPNRGAEPFARLYGLTPVEARVATIIVNANSGRSAARMLGISYNTIKTHLKRIYAKTGAQGHCALMRMLVLPPDD
jgi:DNA-binding CsgD family transcriptional regulator